jgi:hypothetical protein
MSAEDSAAADADPQALRDAAVADEDPNAAALSAFPGVPPAPVSATRSFLDERIPITGRAPLTRKQMIEYLTLRSWLVEACNTMPFTLLMWVSFIYLLHTHAQVHYSFQVSRSVIEHIENIVADPMAGLVPEDGSIMATDPGAKGPQCICACNLAGPEYDVCTNPYQSGEVKVSEPVPGLTMPFQREVTLEQMAALRTAAVNLTAKRQQVQEKQLQLHDVRTIDDIWFWLQRGFIPRVYAEQKKKGPLEITRVFPMEGMPLRSMYAETLDSGTLLAENKIIAGVRLRQIRYEQIDCDTRDELQDFYGQKCHSGRRAKESYGPGTNSFVEGFVPNAQSDTYDFFFDMDRPMDLATENVQFLLRQHNWLDESTGNLEIQAAFLSTKAQLYGLMQIIFMFEFGGRIKTEVKVRTVAATIYPSIFHAIPDMIWSLLILVLLRKELMEVWKHFKSGRGIRTIRTFLVSKESPLYISTSQVERETIEAGGEPHLNLWAHLVSYVSQLDQLELKHHQHLQQHLHDWMEQMDTDPFSLAKQLKQCRYKECKQKQYMKLEVQVSNDFALMLESFVAALLYTGAEDITPAKKTLNDYARDFWNLLDWASIFLGLGIGGFWVYTMYSTQDLNASVGALPVAPSYNAAQAEETAYHDYWTTILDDTEQLFWDKMAHRIAMFWFTMVLMLRFFKSFEGQPRLAEMNRTLVGASQDIVHFIIVFFLLFLSFAVGGYVLFGSMMHEWSTLWRSVNAAFQATMGTINFEVMYSIAPVSASMWYWLYMISIVFVLFNMFMAIMYDHYWKTKSQTGDVMGLPMQLRETLGNGLWYIRWRWEQFRAREPVGASFREMLEELLLRAQASEDVIASTETSVLGPRMLRHKTESLRFKQKQTMEHADDENDPLHEATAKEDLKEMKVDKELADRLLVGCRAYFERQTLPQETRVAQMRDLVKSAEDGFSNINQRFDQCGANLREILSVMDNHLRSLENTSHSTLAELSRTAQDVGIPEAASSKGPSKDVEARVIGHLYQASSKKKKNRNPRANSEAAAAMHKVKKIAMASKALRGSRSLQRLAVEDGKASTSISPMSASINRFEQTT